MSTPIEIDWTTDRDPEIETVIGTDIEPTPSEILGEAIVKNELNVVAQLIAMGVGPMTYTGPQGHAVDLAIRLDYFAIVMAWLRTPEDLEAMGMRILLTAVREDRRGEKDRQEIPQDMNELLDDLRTLGIPSLEEVLYCYCLEHPEMHLWDFYNDEIA
ncbi:hypothetical protein BJX76DRAFT_356935 [Aspergillus varians]